MINELKVVKTKKEIKYILACVTHRRKITLVNKSPHENTKIQKHKNTKIQKYKKTKLKMKMKNICTQQTGGRSYLSTSLLMSGRMFPLLCFYFKITAGCCFVSIRKFYKLHFPLHFLVAIQTHMQSTHIHEGSQG